MADIKITEGITEEHLADIYSDPYILRVGHDHRPAGYIDHPMVKYLSSWVDGAFAGAFMIVKVNQVEWDAHALLKKSSLRYSRDIGTKCAEWIFSHAEVLRITAYVIEGLESARNYCMRLGFKLEGERRSAFVVNGRPKKVYILGLLRSEWEV